MNPVSDIVTTAQLEELGNSAAFNAGTSLMPSSPSQTGAVNAREYLEGVIKELNINVIRELNKPEYEVCFEIDCIFNTGHKKKAVIGNLANGGYFYMCQAQSCSTNGWEAMKKLLPKTTSAPVSSSGSAEWDDPIAIPTTIKVPLLPAELVPESIVEFCEIHQQNLSAPIEHLVLPFLTVMASLIGRKVKVFPKKNDIWIVIPNVYCVVVGDPGTKKSPPVSVNVALLKPLEKAAKEEYEQALAEYKNNQSIWDTKVKAAKSLLEKEMKKPNNHQGIANAEQALNQLLGEEEIQPTLKRYRVSDTTVEKLGVLLQDNPNGLLVVFDELAALLNILKKNGREGDRSFYLMAANGNESLVVDRMTRDGVYVEGVCISIIGTIQPTVLQKFIEESSRNTGDDGFIQRFQLIAFPESIPYVYQDVPMPEAVIASVERIIKRLAGDFTPAPFGNTSNEDGAIMLRFNNEAQELFQAWITDVEARSKDENLSLAMRGHLSKLNSLMPSLAAIYFLLDWANSDADFIQVNGSTEMQVKHALMAAAMCDFLELNAQKVYEANGNSKHTSALALLRKIKDGKLAKSFKRNDIVKQNWAHLNTPEKVDGALKTLETRGWLKIIQQPSTSGKGGRPSETIVVHPEFDNFIDLNAETVPEFESIWLDKLRELEGRSSEVEQNQVDLNPAVDQIEVESVVTEPAQDKVLTAEELFGVTSTGSMGFMRIH